VATYVLFAFTAMRVALKVREVPVPDLRNHTVAEATNTLAAEGLVLHVDESGRLDPKVPTGRIAIQEPAPGSITRRQRSIKVWVSQGPRVTVIPSLTGESERSAALRLQEDGLSVTSVAEIRSAEYPSGAIIAQEPPGQAQGTAVALLVNRGEQSNRYVMPDLIGVTGSRAVDLLRARGFRVSIVGELPYPGVPAGTVLRQSPSAGFQIGAGEPISLEVSR
jgi:serine/threonine-protein kinase